MNEKTKTYYWLPWAIAISSGLVLFWGLAYFDLRWPGIWEVAQGVDTIRAINEFGSGITDMETYWEQRLQAFSGLIILFVLGPSLWIYSEIRNQEKASSDPEDRLKKGPLWYAGVILVVVGLNYAIPVTVMKGVAFNNTWESAEESRNIDKIRGELLTLASEAVEQYYYLLRTVRKAAFFMVNTSFHFSSWKATAVIPKTRMFWVLFNRTLLSRFMVSDQTPARNLSLQMQTEIRARCSWRLR